MYLFYILTSDNIIETINKNQEYLFDLMPELKNMVGFEHKHPHHHLDVWNHTLYAMSLSNNDFEIRLCLLLHDIGKPFSYTEEDNIRHFTNHPKVSAKIGKEILQRLAFDNHFINEVCYLIENHDAPISIDDIKNNCELSYKRYLIQKCDVLAHNPNELEKRKKYLENIESMFQSQKEKVR